MSLSLVWYILVSVLFIGYFLLDGFDFGVGILMSLRSHNGEGGIERRVLLNTIGPVWDGNEVWIVAGIGAIFAAFPVWYADLFNMLYLPLLLLLVGLIVRVVAIEWRGKISNKSWKIWADYGTALGSWLPAFLWGAIFSTTLYGVSLADPSLLSHEDNAIFSFYSLLGGLITLALFLLHGSVFAVLKTTGDFRVKLQRFTHRLFGATLVMAIIYATWTVNLHYYTTVGRNISYGAVILIALGFLLLSLNLYYEKDLLSFFSTSIIIIGIALMLFWHNYPVLIAVNHNFSQSLTVTSAASSHYTLTIMTWAALVFTPIVVGYQTWSYWVFRKRISAAQIPDYSGLNPTITQQEKQVWKNVLGKSHVSLVTPESVS